jgi:penicillin-binding protein 2
MRDVVHTGYGTGTAADLGFTIMCGKTGTAQWKPEKNQNLAWFSGFFPYENPRYAFAVVYEGIPNESVSGGRNAAPMVRRFFRNFRTEIEENLKPPAKAMIVREEDDNDAGPDIGTDTIPKAMVVDDDQIPVAVPVEEDPDDIPVAVPVAEEPGEIPAALPVEPAAPAPPIPTVPDALPISPPAPADTPRPEPEVPADR